MGEANVWTEEFLYASGEESWVKRDIVKAMNFVISSVGFGNIEIRF